MVTITAYYEDSDEDQQNGKVHSDIVTQEGPESRVFISFLVGLGCGSCRAH